MSARARGWLAATVTVLLVASLTVLIRAPIGVLDGETGTTATGTLVAGRPVPPGSGAIQTSTPPSSQAPAQEVQRLLDRRAAAIRQRDEPGFLASLDPLAEPAFVAAQRAVFGNLQDVPLAEWSYRVDGTVLASPPARASPAGDQEGRYAPHTTLRYALRGVDPVPTERPLGYLYVRRGDRWFLASDTALGSGTTWRGPWDFGPCTVLTGPGGLVLGHPGHEQDLAAVAADLDGAVRAVTRVWGTDWPQRAAVLLPAGEDEFRAQVGPGFDATDIAAAAVADRVDPASHTAAGQRVVFNPAEAGRLSATSRRIVLRHELTHLATRASTVDGAPMWLLEGLADYVGYRDSGLAPREAAPDLARAVSGDDLPAGLPSDADFRRAGGRLDLAYQLAWSVALYVAERAGEAGLVRLYRRVAGDRGLGPSTVDAAVDAALRETLGTDHAGLVASWREWLPSRFG